MSIPQNDANDPEAAVAPCESSSPAPLNPRPVDQYLSPKSQRTVAIVALGASTPFDSILVAAQTCAAAVKPTCRPSSIASRRFHFVASLSLTAMEHDISSGSHMGGTVP